MPGLNFALNPWQSPKNAISQGRISHRTTGKSRKTRFARVEFRAEPLAKSRKRDLPGSRTPQSPLAKTEKRSLSGSDFASKPWQMLKKCISQGRARPNHPWQPPQNLHLPGSTFPSPRLHPHPLHTFIMVPSHPFPFPKTGHDQTLQPSSKTPPTTSKHKIPPPNPLITRDKFDTMG